MSTDSSDNRRNAHGTVEDRRTRRAFRSAMSAGLKKAFDPVADRSVPREFMDLLAMADARRS